MRATVHAYDPHAIRGGFLVHIVLSLDGLGVPGTVTLSSDLTLQNVSDSLAVLLADLSLQNRARTLGAIEEAAAEAVEDD